MSYAPQTLLDARAYILAHTDLSPAEVGIVGDGRHTYGYHLGKDRLPPNDYSAVHPRDKAGLTNAASALDIGDFGDLWRLTEFLVAEARAGRLPDVREIIGPLRDGRAYRWDHLDGWTAVRRAKGDSHEWHIHISYYRDSEHRDKTAVFRRFFEEDLDVDEATLRRIIREETAYRNIRPAAWMRKLFPGIPDDGYDWASYSRAAYGYGRLAAEQTLPEISAKLEGILAAVKDQDVVDAVKAELAKHDQAVKATLADIAAAVAKVGSVPADQIVDEIARRLAEAG